MQLLVRFSRFWGLALSVPFFAVMVSTATPVRAATPVLAATPAEPPTESPSAPEPLTPPLHGQLVLKSMPLSPIVNRKITTWVYLPPGYDDVANAMRRYPTVYLLHGQPGGWTDCYRSGKVEEMADAMIWRGEMPPVILVAFDADGPRGAKDLTDFCNRVSDNYRAEDFITQELVPYIDANYRTVPNPESRVLWGYSAGGYGALNLGFKHPDLWRVLCSHAGFYSPADDEDNMKTILGPKGPAWDANDTLKTINAVPATTHLHVYMDASPNEEGYDEFEALTNQLKARGDNVSTQSLPKAHAWKLIVNRCRDSLLFIGRSISGTS